MIRVQNIYYMLAYAYKILNEQGYIKIAAEEFENTADLLAAILVRGVSIQIKRGLSREYNEYIETLSGIRGRINTNASIKSNTLTKKQLVCEFDEFTEDSYLNRIIKTTSLLLLHSDIPTERKKELRHLMLYFSAVNKLEPNRINWNIRFNRNNQSYQMLIGICYFVIKGLLQRDMVGNYRMGHIFDEQRMCRLYEKFILEYYKKEHPELSVRASQIPWNLDNESNDFLPVMQSDITLSDGNRTLIIDAKYYSKTMQTQFDVRTLHSNNLYQIFTYVKNKDVNLSGNVTGLLLYAKTDEDILPDNTYSMSGNKIIVRTLDLNADFKNIAGQLDDIVKDAFT